MGDTTTESTVSSTAVSMIVKTHWYKFHLGFRNPGVYLYIYHPLRGSLKSIGAPRTRARVAKVKSPKGRGVGLHHQSASLLRGLSHGA